MQHLVARIPQTPARGGIGIEDVPVEIVYEDGVVNRLEQGPSTPILGPVVGSLFGR